MVKTVQWMDEDRRFLESVAKLIARGWRPHKFFHYQSLAARLQAMGEDYEDEDVERYCLRVFRMDSHGFMRRRHLKAHFSVRAEPAADRRDGQDAGSVPLDDTDIDTGAPPADWIREIEEGFQGEAINTEDIRPYPIPTRTGTYPEEEIMTAPNRSEWTTKKPRIRHWIPIVGVALALWLMPKRFLGGLIGGMAGAGEQMNKGVLESAKTTRLDH